MYIIQYKIFDQKQNFISMTNYIIQLLSNTTNHFPKISVFCSVLTMWLTNPGSINTSLLGDLISLFLCKLISEHQCTSEEIETKETMLSIC